jgi:hypothetical protein
MQGQLSRNDEHSQLQKYNAEKMAKEHDIIVTDVFKYVQFSQFA